MVHYDVNLSLTKFFDNSDVINMISEIIVALKYMKRERLFRTLETTIKFSVKNFLVNVTKSTFSCVFDQIY